MEKVNLLFGGRSPIIYDHDLSVNAYLGMMEDYRGNPPDDFRIGKLFYMGQDDRVYIHSLENSSDHPETIEALRTGTAISFREMVPALHDSGNFVYCLLYGENADEIYPGVERMFDLPSRFGSIYAGAVGSHKWTQSLVVNTLLPHMLTPIPMRLIPADASPESDAVQAALREFADQACVIKSNRLHMGAHSVRLDSLTLGELEKTMADIRPHDDYVLVQKFIAGEEYTCGCLKTSEGMVALPPVKTETDRDFLGYDEKIKGNIRTFVEKNPDDRLKRMQQANLEIFEFMKFALVCRSDFIVDEDDRIYYLETNVTPGLSRISPYTLMLKAVGLTRLDLIRNGLFQFRTSRSGQRGF